MGRITEMQYEYAKARVEDLLPMVDGYCDPNSREALELSLVSDVVIEYEREHFPVEKPSPAELIALGLEEKGMTQKELAAELGLSPSRVCEYISGKAEPSLKTAGVLCRILGIQPSAILGL